LKAFRVVFLAFLLPDLCLFEELPNLKQGFIGPDNLLSIINCPREMLRSKFKSFFDLFAIHKGFLQGHLVVEA
jgi:hypothetical protein